MMEQLTECLIFSSRFDGNWNALITGGAIVKRVIAVNKRLIYFNYGLALPITFIRMKPSLRSPFRLSTTQT